MFTSNSNTSLNSVVKLSCETGYVLATKAIVVCQQNGEWSPAVSSCITATSGGELLLCGNQPTFTTDHGFILNYLIVNKPRLIYRSGLTVVYKSTVIILLYVSQQWMHLMCSIIIMTIHVSGALSAGQSSPSLDTPTRPALINVPLKRYMYSHP